MPGARGERPPIGDLVAMRGSAPAARRRRHITPWRLTALIAALVLAAGTYALGRYVVAPKPTQGVTVAITTKTLAPGDRLRSNDFRIVTIQGSWAPSQALSPSQVPGQVSRYAKVPIPDGSFLKSGMLDKVVPKPAQKQVLVGLALKPGHVPTGGLAVGQRVTLLLLGDSSPGPPVVTNTMIWEVLPPNSSGAAQVTVLVPSGKAQKIARLAAQGQVSLYIPSASSG
jgi:hypothetical protein